jgi:hypothetical protein
MTLVSIQMTLVSAQQAMSSKIFLVALLYSTHHLLSDLVMMAASVMPLEGDLPETLSIVIMRSNEILPMNCQVGCRRLDLSRVRIATWRKIAT